MKAVKCCKGFTLVELLVSLSIIIMVSAWIVPQLNHYFQFSHNSAAKAGAANIANSISQYKYEMGFLPTTLNDLTKTYNQYGPWLTAASLKDPWGRDWIYVKTKDNYAVWSAGANGNDDTGNNITIKFNGDDIGIIAK